ncbi:hypothetical protein pEaSNUABM37_00057 [Erwinia phage pEa_SNUABM_37]|nr:hypothetical protein pEaSNUABM37_00057 [Erwinia phage pEa_SNUABM_37]QXO10527.1 hypothetical protein pEaSNUABM48_00057 [Erwinia phage pEa_SNUABM_48]
MSEPNVLKQSTFPLNNNLVAIEADGVGKYPFVFLLEEATTEKLLKLNDNLKALGKDPIDTNKTINEALASALDGLLSRNKHPHDLPDYFVPKHFFHPEVGDWWNERCCGYGTVHEVFSDDDFVFDLTANLAGLEPGLYRINRQWLARFVAYDWKALLAKPEGQHTASEFCADPMRGSTRRPETEAKRAAWYALNKEDVKDIRQFAPADK